MLEFRAQSKKILLSTEAEKLIRSYWQRPGQFETGGALAGMILRDETIVITHAMVPSAKNKAGRFWLLQDREAQQLWVDKIFRETRKQSNFVGEWHTHPASKVTPSGPDKKRMDDLLKTSRLEIDFLVGLIVGMDQKIHCWIQHKRRSQKGFWFVGRH